MVRKFFASVRGILKLTKDIFQGRKYVGEDIVGNKYFVIVSSDGTEHRSVEYFDKNLEVIDQLETIPEEWEMWLRNLSDKPPTPEYSRYLAMKRAEMRRNIQKYEEEEERKKILQSLNDKEQESSKIINDAFLNGSEKLSAEEGFLSDHHGDTNLTPHTMKDDVNNEGDFFSHGQKGADVSGMNPEETRDILRQYSNTRSSSFLNSYPQVRDMEKSKRMMEMKRKEKQRERERDLDKT